MNSCTFVGRIGRDPELKQVGQNDLLSFSLASDTGFGDNKKTIWLDCSIWGKRANSLQPYLKKGTQMTAIGSISERSYTNKDGVEKTALQMNVGELSFSSDKSQGGASQQPQSNNGALDDDIPF